jgi:hypothetical protein
MNFSKTNELDNCTPQLGDQILADVILHQPGEEGGFPIRQRPVDAIFGIVLRKHHVVLLSAKRLASPPISCRRSLTALWPNWNYANVSRKDKAMEPYSEYYHQ